MVFQSLIRGAVKRCRRVFRFSVFQTISILIATSTFPGECEAASTPAQQELVSVRLRVSNGVAGARLSFVRMTH